MKPLVRATTVLGFAGVTFVTSYASAHVRLVSPTPRYASPTGMDNGMNIKDPPCGRAMNDMRTTDMSRITVYEPGATIMVQWNETIDHPGHYRIAFDDAGQDAFMTPLMRSQVQAGPTFTAPVLLDSIMDKQGGMYTAMVTLPNVECETCTLQLIQVMTTGMMWAVDDIYYTCADIALRRTGGGGGMGGMSGSGGSGGSPQGGSGGASAGSGGAGGGPSGGTTGLGGGGAGGMATGGAGGTSGGVAPTGGVSTGGALTGGTGGTPATGGVPAGGAPSGGAPAAGTGQAPVEPNTPTEEAGCGCRTVPSGNHGMAFTAAALALLGMLVRRRRGSRSSAA